MLAAALIVGCTSRTTSRSMASDIYAMRLAIENLQTFESAANESLSAEIRSVRAHQDQQMGSLGRRIDELQDEIVRLEDALERLRLTIDGYEETGTGEFTRVRHELSLPPDREIQPERLPSGQIITPPPPPRGPEADPQPMTNLPTGP